MSVTVYKNNLALCSRMSMCNNDLAICSFFLFIVSPMLFNSISDSSEVKCLAVVQRVAGSSLGPLTGLCKNLRPGQRKGSQSALVKKEHTS